ncbi:MAG: glycosyltransferase family 2 protein [Bacilli bacterium]|jgi:hypothetical protein
MNKILLIIPAYNEQDNILNTVNSIKKSKIKVDYIVINDGSTDETAQVCMENDINHINLVHNLGIGGAVQTGYKYALNNGYDIAVQFDGDGQHDIKYVDHLVNPIINENMDFVIGSRFIEDKSQFKSTKIRQAGIKIISALIRICTGKRIYDTTSGFRACNKQIIKEFAHDYPTEYPEPTSTVWLLKKHYKIKEIPVEMKERKFGNSSIRKWKSLYYMVNVMLSIIVVSIRRYK